MCECNMSSLNDHKNELWNVKNLDSPAITTYKAETRDVDLHTLHEIFVEALNIFENQNELEQEAAILSRCIYRMKMRLRSDKGLKAIEKVNRALLQFLRMRFSQTLRMFYEMIPQKYERETYLPSLNMLHYILVRTQGVSKLMIRIAELSKTAGYFMQNRIYIGHIWNTALILFAVVSRIYCLTKDIAKFCCAFYSELVPFGDKLQCVGIQWLPPNYCLPVDLKVWLNVEWLIRDDDLVEEPTLKVPTIFDILDSDSDVEFCGEYIDLEDDIEVTDEYIEVHENSSTPEEDSVIVVDNELVMQTDEDNSIKKRKKPKVKHIVEATENKPETNRNIATVAVVEEDVGEVVDPCNIINAKRKRPKRIKTGITLDTTEANGNLGAELASNWNSNSIKNKRKQKSKSRKALKENKPETAKRLISKINTLQDLKGFSRDFAKIQKANPNVFKDMDKLQCNMLHNVIKKLIRKAKKGRTDSSKVNSCISEAVDVLKSGLM